MLTAFSVTDIGKKRRINEDFVYVSEKPVGNLPNLFIVADGMGGHNAGDFASKITVETMLQKIANSAETDPALLLGNAIVAANTMLRRLAAEDTSLEGMGTTVVAAACMGNRLQVVNVGDSRLYVSNKRLHQITKDHSLVEEMVQMGSLERSEVKNHPGKNIITRAVGAQDMVHPDFFAVDLAEGDLVLLCSDGLTNMLEDEAIQERLCGSGDIAQKAGDLVNAANENGGRDNISVILGLWKNGENV